MILNDEMNLISYEGGNLMYVFNKITVTPQLPERINKLSEIAGNLWWAWNTDFLKLFKIIDGDLWETVGKNPVKFLKLVSPNNPLTLSAICFFPISLIHPTKYLI